MHLETQFLDLFREELSLINAASLSLKAENHWYKVHNCINKPLRRLREAQETGCYKGVICFVS